MAYTRPKREFEFGAQNDHLFFTNKKLKVEAKNSDKIDLDLKLDFSPDFFSDGIDMISNPIRSLKSPFSQENDFDFQLPDLDRALVTLEPYNNIKQDSPIFYHATAIANFPNIKKIGLSIHQRGVNTYRLDILESYSYIYGEEAKKYQKPPCIHLSKFVENGIDFGKDINFIFKTAAVVMEVHLTEEEFKQLKPDQECGREREGQTAFIYCSNISEEKIKPLHIVAYDEKTKQSTIHPYSDQLIESLLVKQASKKILVKKQKEAVDFASDLESENDLETSDNEVEVPEEIEKQDKEELILDLPFKDDFEESDSESDAESQKKYPRKKLLG